MEILFQKGKKRDVKALWFNEDGSEVNFINQRVLPHKIEILKSNSVEKTAEYIKTMVIRGAPSIGIAGAYGIVQSVSKAYEMKMDKTPKKFYNKLIQDSNLLFQTRPTAIDLKNSLDTMLSLWSPEISDTPPLLEDYRSKSLELTKNLIDQCKAIAKTGLSLIKNGFNIITHCHTGSFATVDIGTAIAPLKLAVENGMDIHVYVDETRPRFQGGKLTAWELKQAEVPCTIITDSTAASLMKTDKIDLAIVGADRIACNGDFANKIGTYNLAVICFFHKIPFYTAAPWSTFHTDLIDGNEIPIEERDTKEITHTMVNKNHEHLLTYDTKSVYNPAFDVTPNSLLSGIIVPGQILVDPFKDSIENVVIPILKK